MSKTPTPDEIWKILKEIALNQKEWEKKWEKKSLEEARQEKKRAEEEARQEKKRAEEEARQEKKRAEAEARQEKKRAEEEARQEKKRAEAEARQEKKRAEEKAREEKEWAEWKKKDQKKIEEIRILQKEAELESKKTEKLLHKVIGDSGNRWGKLGENLVKGQLAQRLKERGIKVERVITNAKGPFSEFDLIAINGKEVVVVEVKATLDPSDVNEFEENIKNFKTWWPEFKNKTLYGGMAFLIKSNRQADSLAQKRGFFVIEATGDVIFQNEKDFKPRVFS